MYQFEITFSTHFTTRNTYPLRFEIIIIYKIIALDQNEDKDVILFIHNNTNLNIFNIRLIESNIIVLN